MSQRQFTVGTDPVLVANGRTNRSSIIISFLPSSVAAGNTGVVYVQKGSPAAASPGAPSSGDALTQGSQWAESGQYANDPNVFQGQVWAVADTAGQSITVDESYTG
jgi:hypothetical protein